MIRTIKSSYLLLFLLFVLNACTFSMNARIVSDHDLSSVTAKLIAPATLINSSNTNSFTFSGSCSNTASVDISFNNTIKQNVICNSGTWTLTTDLSSIVDGNIDIIILQPDSTTVLDTNSILKDSTPPSMIGVIFSDGSSINSTSSTPTLTWNAGSDIGGSGIEKYQIALGSTSGGTDVLNWVDVSLTTSTSLNGLSLSFGNTYYASLRAVDVAGNVSSTVLGDGWTATAGNGTAIVTAGLPSSPSADNSISLTVGGTDVVAYKYKYGIQGSIDCASSSGYSSEIPVATVLSADIRNIDDGTFLLCLIGKDSGSNYQSYASATTYTWIRSAPAEIQFSTLSQSVDEDAAGTISFNFSLNHKKSENVTVEYEVQGTALYMINHNLSSNTITIPAGNLTASVPFQIFGDALALPETYLRVIIVGIDSQKLTLGSNKSHTVIINDNDSGAYKVISEMSFGQTHGCLIYSNNDLYCWGKNKNGQLGNNSIYDLAQPVFVGAGYLKVSANGSHTCAIKTDNKLWCWGFNSTGQLGLGNTTEFHTPQAVDAATNYVEVSAGSSHTCAITTAKKLKCWGSNGNGRLGDNSISQRTLPVAIDTASDYSKVSAGYAHTCGIIDISGALKCWGADSDSQLGDSTLSSDQLTPYVIDSGTTYKFISAGAFGSCGITSSDDLKCWGGNYNGEFGDVASWYPDPTVLDPGVKYSFVSTGIEVIAYAPHSCGVTTANEVKCWGGDSGYGRIGVGKSWSNYYLPTASDPSVTYSKVFAGSINTCGLTLAGLPKCWGSSLNSQSLSLPNVISTPTLIYPERNFKSIWLTTGGCAIDSADKAWCWNSPDNTNAPESQLIRRNSSTTYKIATSSCEIQLDGVLRCYQSGNWVALDFGTTYKSLTEGGTNPHFCGITSSDQLKCWGSNNFGQVGNNSTVDVASPTIIDGGNTYLKVSAGMVHTCAIDTNNKIKCWGFGTDGRLGDGTNTQRLVPTLISDGSNYSDISAGYTHTCGIISTTGQLKCWGYNDSGQLGNGNTTQQASPVAIDAVSTYQQVSVGYSSSCAVTIANKLKCWGSNTYTFLGLNSPASYLGTGNYNTNETSPVAIDASTDYSQVFISHTDRKACAITTGSKIKCWGQAAKEYEVNLPIGVDPYHPNPSVNLLHPSF